MAAGAIPPPLFFERRRHAGIFARDNGISGTPGKSPSVDQAVERPAPKPDYAANRSPPKDI
jgi:hypothetical protein